MRLGQFPTTKWILGDQRLKTMNRYAYAANEVFQVKVCVYYYYY